jgi:hypothetical protein
VTNILKFIATLAVINFCLAPLMSFAATATLPAPQVKASPGQPQKPAPPAKTSPDKTREHPADGTWLPEREESAKTFTMPDGLKNDLVGMQMTITVKSGSMLLSWSDGVKSKKTFRILSSSGNLYNVIINDKKFTMNAVQPNRLVLTETDAYGRDNSIIFKRAK